MKPNFNLKFFEWLTNNTNKNMTPTLAQILASAQALVSQVSAYIAATSPTTGPVPVNVAAALSAVSAASAQLQSDLTASPFTLGSPSPAVIVTDVANLLAAVQSLSGAVASPSNP